MRTRLVNRSTKKVMLGMRKMPILNMSFRKTRAKNRDRLGSVWDSFSVSKSALANLIGGFPATVTGSPSRDRI